MFFAIGHHRLIEISPPVITSPTKSSQQQQDFKQWYEESDAQFLQRDDRLTDEELLLYTRESLLDEFRCYIHCLKNERNTCWYVNGCVFAIREFDMKDNHLSVLFVVFICGFFLHFLCFLFVRNCVIPENTKHKKKTKKTKQANKKKAKR